MISNEMLLIGIVAGFALGLLYTKLPTKKEKRQNLVNALVDVSKLALYQLYIENQQLAEGAEPIRTIQTRINFEEEQLQVKIQIEVQ
jgi:uncharacterized membrane-anchored protein YhcB (DUF1043 family)